MTIILFKKKKNEKFVRYSTNKNSLGTNYKSFLPRHYTIVYQVGEKKIK